MQQQRRGSKQQQATTSGVEARRGEGSSRRGRARLQRNSRVAQQQGAREASGLRRGDAQWLQQQGDSGSNAEQRQEAEHWPRGRWLEAGAGKRGDARAVHGREARSMHSATGHGPEAR